MSTLKVGGIRGVSASSDAITVANDGTCTANITNNLSNRNLIINGAMQVAQRVNPTPASSFTTAGYGACDRWRLRALNTDQANFVISQESDAPTGSGFSKSIKIKTNTAESSLDSNEIFHVSQVIEAQNLQHLKNGTSSALSVTLSFWVKAYQVGTYVINIFKGDNTGRQISATYTISASNTWEFKTMTFPGDTSGGGIADDTGAGFYIYWVLAAGSGFTGTTSTSWGDYADGGFANGQTVNIMSSTNNYFYLTGVQLEVGSVATDFEHLSIADVLAKCQRYFYQATKIGSSSDVTNMPIAPGFYLTGSDYRAIIDFPVEMRAAPTVSSNDNSGSYYIHTNATADTIDRLDSFQNTKRRSIVRNTAHAGGTQGHFGMLHQETGDSNLNFSAEL